MDPMTALPESDASPSSPIRPQPHISATSDGEPTFSHAATSSEPSLPGGRNGIPFGWITFLPLNAGQPLLETLGYRARRDLPLRTWAIWRFIFSCALALLQIIAVANVAGLAFVHGEYASCHGLTVTNFVWAGKLLLFQFYPEGWFLYQRLKLRGEPVHGTPALLCPPDQATLMSVVTFVEVPLVVIWILVQVVLLVVHGRQCYVYAPAVSILAFVILALALLYYLPTTGLLVFRRSREPRAGNHHDVEIGPLPQSKVDRIDLVYYIPHPPPAPVAVAVARPSGPVAGFRRFGRVLRTRAADDGAEQTPRGNINEEWENTFQRMPHALLRVERHEAQCAICLEDYTEPPRAIPGSATASATQSADADAQGAPEPLRWLDCGHVFHKGCLDPCLTQGPAKCPTCRTPVKVRPPTRK